MTGAIAVGLGVVAGLLDMAGLLWQVRRLQWREPPGMRSWLATVLARLGVGCAALLAAQGLVAHGLLYAAAGWIVSRRCVILMVIHGKPGSNDRLFTVRHSA